MPPGQQNLYLFYSKIAFSRKAAKRGGGGGCLDLSGQKPLSGPNLFCRRSLLCKGPETELILNMKLMKCEQTLTKTNKQQTKNYVKEKTLPKKLLLPVIFKKRSLLRLPYRGKLRRGKCSSGKIFVTWRKFRHFSRRSFPR